MSCSFLTVDSVCGPTPYAPNELRVIPQKSCRKDLTDYLTTLGVSGSLSAFLSDSEGSVSSTAIDQGESIN